LDRRVLLVESANGIPPDISLAALPFEERIIDRSSDYAFGSQYHVSTCSAEDLVVLKAFADRPQDWLDIEGVIVRQGAGLNRAQVRGADAAARTERGSESRRDDRKAIQSSPVINSGPTP
jgi:hypothetical protein